MSKFVIGCPDCGRYVEIATGFFAKKKVKCTCGRTINAASDKMTSKRCPHCGNDVIYVGSDGYLRVCDVETLAEKRRVFVGAPSYVSVTAAHGMLIVADLCGRVTAY